MILEAKVFDDHRWQKRRHATASPIHARLSSTSVSKSLMNHGRKDIPELWRKSFTAVAHLAKADAAHVMHFEKVNQLVV